MLSQGRQLYFGEAAEAESWFSDQLGFPMPAHTAAADYIMVRRLTHSAGGVEASGGWRISHFQSFRNH